jgi:Ca2+-binding RTX toxin-like protein
VTIKGVGTRRTIIDAKPKLGNDAVPVDRVVHVRAGVEARVSRLTMRNGRQVQGGGVFVDGGTLGLRRVRVLSNVADDLGGGVYSDRGKLRAFDSTFVGNTAHDDGGGIATNRPPNTTLLRRVKVLGNSASEDAGGVEIEEGALTLSDSTISGNSTMTQDGGGIEIDAGSDQASMRATNSAIFGNRSADNGGGIENDNGQVHLVNTTVSGNIAANYGGGIDQTVRLNPQPEVRDLDIINSTLQGNRSRGGGGISSRTGNEAFVRNSVIAANLPENCGGAPPVDGGVVAVISQGFNLASDQTCTLTQPSDMPGTDPRLGPLALNGGRTRTHALLLDSPAIDAAVGSPDTDQRGVPRPQGGGPDMGAFELEYCLGRRPTVTGAGTISGTGGDDVILGSVAADDVAAGAGDDRICTGDGNDSIRGGPGDDRADGGSGDDRLWGQAGTDQIHGRAGNDELLGKAGADALWGDTGDDVLRGGPSADRLLGGDGQDSIIGGTGRDSAFGGEGGDRIAVLDGVHSNDIANGEAGLDICTADPGDSVINCP